MCVGEDDILLTTPLQPLGRASEYLLHISSRYSEPAATRIPEDCSSSASQQLSQHLTHIQHSNFLETYINKLLTKYVIPLLTLVLSV